jgi:hypothetical protein
MYNHNIEKAMKEESRDKVSDREYPSLTGSGYERSYFEVPS